MKIEINVDAISNKTLSKLTWREIGDLGLSNCGIFCYHGQLKTRKQGFKRAVVNERETVFEAESYRVEFIRIEQTDEDPNYAMRVFEKGKGYQMMVSPLVGVEFFK